ncbi:hypothetical protein R6Q57_003836 [Mikania cordata]
MHAFWPPPDLYPSITAWSHTSSSTSYLHPKVKEFGDEGDGSAPAADGGGYGRIDGGYGGSAGAGGGYEGSDGGGYRASSGGTYIGSGGGDVKFRERSVTDDDPRADSDEFRPRAPSVSSLPLRQNLPSERATWTWGLNST